MNIDKSQVLTDYNTKVIDIDLQQKKNDDVARSISKATITPWVVERPKKEIISFCKTVFAKSMNERFVDLVGMKPSVISINSLPEMVLRHNKGTLDITKASPLLVIQLGFRNLKKYQLMLSLEKLNMEYLKRDVSSFFKLNGMLKTKKNNLIILNEMNLSRNEKPEVNEAPKFNSLKAIQLSLQYLVRLQSESQKWSSFAYEVPPSAIQTLSPYLDDPCEEVRNIAKTLILIGEFEQAKEHHRLCASLSSKHKLALLVKTKGEITPKIDIISPALSASLLVFNHFRTDVKELVLDENTNPQREAYYIKQREIHTLYENNKINQEELFNKLETITQKLLKEIKIVEQKKYISSSLLEIQQSIDQINLAAYDIQEKESSLQKTIQAEKNQKAFLNELENESKHKQRKEKKVPIGKEKLIIKEVIQSEKPQPAPKFTEIKKVSLPKYELFGPSPIKYTERVLRWLNLKPNEKFNFEEYKEYDDSYREKMRILHGFTTTIDHIALDPNYGYVDGDCIHIFVALQLPGGTVDTGVITYHFLDKEKTICDHRFHSYRTLNELVQKGFTDTLEKGLERLDDTTKVDEKGMSTIDQETGDACWLHSDGYLTVDDNKNNIPIHVFKKHM